MQLFRTLCVVAVLGALTYGAYVTLTKSPPVEPPLDAVNWSSPPRIELPTGTAAAKSPLPPAVAGSTTTSAPPALTAAPPFASPSGTAAASPSSPGATITGIRPQENSASVPPSRYPSTNIPPGPFDAVGSLPLANTTPPPAAASADSTLPGTSLSSVASAAGNSSAAAPLTPVTPASAVGTNAPTNASVIPTAASPVPASPAAPSAGTSPSAEVQSLLAQNQLVAALEKLSESFDSPTLSAEEDRRVMELLDQLAGTVIYSREHLLLPAHTIRPGERLDHVASQYQVPWELLAKINGLVDPWNLPPGTQLKVVQGPFDALVDRGRRRLTLFLDGRYAGSFPVGFGRDRPPVDGEYVIGGKMANPSYVGPDLQLPADDPNNPLGERLLDLGNGQIIHGTVEPANLTSDDARGCIRLSARDVEDVYDILVPGSRVIIRP